MSSTPIKKQLLGLIFLLLICFSMPLDAITVHVPSGWSDPGITLTVPVSPLRANETVKCSVSSNNGTGTVFCPDVTNDFGNARVTLLFHENACSTYKVRVWIDTHPGSFTEITVIHSESCPTAPSSLPPESTKLFIVSGYDQTGIVDEPLAEPFVVRVRDRNQDNKPLEGVGVTFTVLTGGGSLSTTTAVTDVRGLAKSTLTLGNEPGTNTVEVRAEGVSKAVTFSAEATLPSPDPTSLSIISGDNQKGLTGEPLPNPLVTEVRDQRGDPMAGVTVTFTVLTGSGTLSAETVMTDANGRAESTLTLGTDPGTVTVKASVEGISQTEVFNAEATLPPPTPTTLSIISGENQEGLTGAPLANLLIVQVHDQYGDPLAGIMVTFAATAGDGSLSATTTITDENGQAESTLTLGTDPGPNTVEVSVEGIAQTVTFSAIAELLEFNLSLSIGLNLIHLPLRVRAVDGMPATIQSVSELYNALGGAEAVNFLITYGSATQEWLSYFVPSDKGTPADRGLTADMGIIAGMRAPVSVQLSGDALGADGSSTITLNQGLNVVGLPLRDSRVTRVSDLFALDGIGGNVSVIILSDGGGFQSVGRVGDPGDIEITGGQAFILTAKQPATITISGDAWTNVSGTAASPRVTRKGIEVGNSTPILALKGSVVDEGVRLNKLNFRVIVKNLSTDKNVATATTDNQMGYRFTVVDIETGRAATVGDILEISAQSLSPFVGVTPLWYTVTTEDVKRNRIRLPTLVAYEIPVETELLYNYPNPFNPETWIPYRLAEDAFVTLIIYDTTGEVVRRIDVGYKPAATYETRTEAIYWNGCNEFGEQVGSGVYFYHLSTGEYSATRKMLIIK